MAKPIIIAVDAMGGDDAPQKVLDGIELHHNKTENIFYNIFGNKESINSILKHKKINTNNFEIIHTDKKIMGEDCALIAAKRGKDTSMWLAIESVKNKDCDVVISAGNTGALLVISKLNLKMI